MAVKPTQSAVFARAVKRLQMMLAALLCVCSLSALAETAAAVDDADGIAAAKIIQNQQRSGAAAQQPPEAAETAQPAPEIANDMADGESIRSLPTLNEPVIDQAQLLTPAEKQAISQQIIKLHESSKAQVGVIIVPATGQEDIFGFAMRTAEAWKLGSAKQDNGLLIAVAVNDRRIQILSGYGLEGVLPDIVLSRIIREQITPYFKQNQYAQGIQAGIGEIENVLNMDPETAAKAAQELKERQEQALHQQQARSNTMNAVLVILIAGIFASYLIGNRLSASVAAVAGTAAGLVYGLGLVTSLMIGAGIFFLLITALAQMIFQIFASSGGRGGGSGGGGFGGGGYSGGGGGFGGGGASGSW